MKSLMLGSTATFVFLAGVIAGSMAWPIGSTNAQTAPAYPDYETVATKGCNRVSPACQVCPFGPGFTGCDSGIPSGWYTGTCSTTGTNCKRSSFRQCGDQIDCFDDTYTGIACFFSTICR